jgi:hypothetical protein
VSLYKSKLHEHALLFVPFDSRTCDICSGKNIESSYQCKPCDFDICQVCYKKFNNDTDTTLPSSSSSSSTPTSSAKKPSKPEDKSKPYGRGMAKMFHPTNGRSLFTKLEPNMSLLSTSVQTTPMIIELARNEMKFRLLTHPQIKMEVIAEDVAQEFGGLDHRMLQENLVA